MACVCYTRTSVPCCTSHESFAQVRNRVSMCDPSSSEPLLEESSCSCSCRPDCTDDTIDHRQILPPAQLDDLLEDTALPVGEIWKAFDKALAWQQQQQEEEEVSKHTNAASAKAVCATQLLPAAACCVQQQQLPCRQGTGASSWQQIATKDNCIVAGKTSEHHAQQHNQPHLHQPGSGTTCAPTQAEPHNRPQQPTLQAQCQTLSQEPSQPQTVEDSGVSQRQSVHQPERLLS